MRLPLALAVCVLAFGCDRCGTKPKFLECEGLTGVQVGHPEACLSSSECADHFNCQQPTREETFMCCISGDRKCVTEADCCAGQTCPTDRKKCFDKFLECTRDQDCGDNGDRFCEDYLDSRGTALKVCRFHTCGTLGECPDGQSCFQGECMATLPCQGTCEAGKACVPTIDRCQDYSMPGAPREAAACPMTCGPGFLATFEDARNIWDSCSLPQTKCVCAELPGLRSEDLGRFSALTVDPGKALWASSYDGQYGDLTVFKFDPAGKLITGFPEYVDGVPMGTPKYGPHGARNGIVEPGDDVGRYTDIAMGPNGTVFVSYYDFTNGNLRFAYRNAGDGKWTTLRVDGDVADTGLYTSLAVDQDGLPGISYFQKGADQAFDVSTCPAPAPTGPKAFITALRFAKATSPTPGPADWTFKTLGCQSRPTPACFQCNATCADPGTGPSCLMPASGGACIADGGASACDANTETCVMVGTAPQCAKKYNPSNLQDIPEGVGLFTSLAFNGRDAFIAYMKRGKPAMATIAKGELWGSQISAAGTVMSPVLLDTSGDTGYFPDVKIDPATRRVAVSYHDFSSKALEYYTAIGFMTGVTPEIIDPGTGAMGSGENDWVGTDSALVYGPNTGQLYVVYQDATKGDLKLAKRGTNAWQILPSIATVGAVGFFADGVFEDGKIFASHARIHAKLIAGEPHVDNALLLDPVAAP